MNRRLQIVGREMGKSEMQHRMPHSDAWSGEDYTSKGLAGVVLHWIRSMRQPAPVRRMHVVETLTLGGKRELKLVECWGQRYLVGCGPDSVQAITQWQRVKSAKTTSGVNAVVGDGEWM